MDRTRVYLTVDTEGAEERLARGRITPPQGYDLRVWCRFRNRSDELGIPLIAHILGEHGLKATFFTEVFGSYFFGLDGLRAACTFLRDRGHDVQLHAHPIQRNAAFRTKGDEPVSDDIGAYDVEAQATLLREGIAILAKCGVPREDVVAFRAGNFGASNATWDAMRKAGLSLSSSYDPCYFDKGCQMRSPEARAGLFEVAPDLWELPITNFEEPGGARRHLQITAVSSDEMRASMLVARAMGVREITLVTHSFELCHIDSIAERTGRPNRVNVRRLQDLCRFLRENDGDFEVDTCGALGKRLARGEERADPAAPRDLPKGTKVNRARRLVEQAYKRLEARARL